jgi:RNA polymerase sigma-70 factor (ECF subfamily)
MSHLNDIGFKDFFASWYNRCFLFAKSYVHDDWVAEDIASGALIKFWEITRSQDIEHPKTLLFTIVKHKTLDYLKHESVRQKTLMSLEDYGKRELEIRISTLDACMPEKIFETDIQNIIHTTLSNLPKKTQQVFRMNRFQNISKKEIAEKLKITVKGVDYHLAKALKSLRECLKDYFPLIPFLFF